MAHKLWPDSLTATCDPTLKGPGLKCGRDESFVRLSTRRKTVSWVWTPAASCPAVPALTPQSVCNQRTGNIWMIGDSLTRLLHLSLSMASGVCVTDYTVLLPCRDGDIRLKFVRSDNLSPANTTIAGVRHSPWYDNFVADTAARTLILNRGAHWVGTPTVLHEMHSLLRSIARDRPDVVVVVRDTPPGHPGCDTKRVRFGRPLRAPLTPRSDWPYHWGEFPAQNEALRELLAREHPRVLLLSVTGATALRADSHYGGKDCLHYCAPGPVDAWAEQLHRVLWGARNSKQIREWAANGSN